MCHCARAPHQATGEPGPRACIHPRNWNWGHSLPCLYIHAIEELRRRDPRGRGAIGAASVCEAPFFRLRRRTGVGRRLGDYHARYASLCQAYRTPVCGVPVHETETGAHSFRIGGATDMADGGMPPTLIQARGRWASDIFHFHIYTRDTDTVEQQSRAVDAILSARVERLLIESVFADFVQPATR
eukprot:scaffold8408_cov149-Isochrysis_galbana.AAC.4